MARTLDRSKELEMGSNSSSDDSDDDDELPAKKCGTRRKRIAIPYDQQVMYDQQAMIGGVRNFPLACKQAQWRNPNCQSVPGVDGKGRAS